MTLLTVFVGCGIVDGKGNDLTYEELVNLTIEEFESDMPEFGDSDYEFYNIDYGDDLRSNSDIKIWKNEKYVELVVYDQSEDFTRTRYYEIGDDGLRNVNGHPDIDFDSIKEKEPDYIEKQGKVIKE
ncbi:hypothetical protein [Oceanobacillus polygoni]|uniref:Uncharacterized protein n=1 Tax=Oceanobacillus polygoni TaxID=1235259 RepID=A0A9X0YW71_9BACI|nr:hypothetical protein [Oceanobacillus polygoni]MBP2079774.1 hypothetical protein [Oceanobacillus polygoni]